MWSIEIYTNLEYLFHTIITLPIANVHNKINNKFLSMIFNNQIISRVDDYHKNYIRMNRHENSLLLIENSAKISFWICKKLIIKVLKIKYTKRNKRGKW